MYVYKLFLQIQFILTAIHSIAGLFAINCNYPKSLMLLIFIQDIIMIFLFWDFYKKAYMRPTKNKKA